MKVLIWIGCIFGYSLIVTGFASGGILLGALPTIALGCGTYALGRYLCKKYEESQRNEAKTAEKESDLRPCDYVPEQEMEAEAKTAVPAVLYCRKCGKKLIEGSDFCGYCGTPVSKE